MPKASAKTRLFGLLAVASICTFAHQARADSTQYAYPNEEATTVYRYAFGLAPYETVVLETGDLSPGADTVMHLWDRNARTELAYDDDGGTGLASRIAYTNRLPVSRNCYLFVRAYSSRSHGTATIRKNGRVLARDAMFAGNRIRLPSGAAYHYETALVPNGARDTYLLGLSSDKRLVAVDDDSGVGLASRISGRTDLNYIVLSHYIYSTPGEASLYVNDHFSDADADGLGALLEADLQTCDSHAQAGCASVFNPADTDRDALSDAAEVFGLDGSLPQPLPRWGSDPRHKDIFVEVDYTAHFVTNPLTQADALLAQTYFDVGSASDLQNPDGHSGVNLHLDIGVAPTNPALATRFGDWGGSNQVPIGTAYQTAPESYRAAIREGVFHYGLVAEGPGGGQGWAPGDRFGWDAWLHDRHVSSFVHELGHNLNLHHHGHESWGVVNCKPNYRSVMNYVFAGDGFSANDALAPINPSVVSEDGGLGEGARPSFLTGNPYFLEVNGDGVDWNRDGQITPSWWGFFPFGYLRSAPTWATWVGCNALDMAPQTLEAGAMLETTPAMTRLRDRLYVFWVGSDQRIHYRQGRISDPDDNGSCPGGDGIDDACVDWHPAVEVPTYQNAKSVAVAAWDDAVVVAFQTASYDSIRVLYALDVEGGGYLTTWSSEVWVSSAWTTHEPELEPMTVDADHFGGASRVLALLWRRRSSSEYDWATTSALGTLWTYRSRVRDASGIAIQGTLSPTLATMGEGEASQHCGAFSNLSSEVRFFCYHRSSDRWHDLGSGAFVNGTRPLTAAKPGLTFHVHRNWLGSEIFGAGHGQFWLTVTPPDSSPKVYLSDTLDESTPADPNTYFHHAGDIGNAWTTVAEGSGVVLYEDSALGTLKGLYLFDVNNPELRFLPLFDGSFDAVLRGGSDFQIMERGICLGLRGKSFCGGASNTVWGL